MKTIVSLFISLLICSFLSITINAQTSKDFSVGSFTKIGLAIPAKMYIVQGNTQKISIDTDDESMKKIEVKVDGNELVIKRVKNNDNFGNAKIAVYITVPVVEEISVAGSGDVYSEKINATNIKLEVAGSGSIEIKALTSEKAESEIAGSGTVKLAGKTKSLDAEIAGSGEIFMFDLVAEDVDVDIAGSGDAQVHATNSLNIEIAGSGDVLYKGNPKNVNNDVAGSGSSKKVD